MLAARLGRSFDVVLSPCVLSQLCAPFTRTLARTAAQWQALMAQVGGAHLELMARLLRPGGQGVAVGDLYLGPDDGTARPLDWASLDRRAVAALRGGVMRLRDPEFLAQLLASAPVRALIADARLTDPWTWTVEGTRMLVYAVLFRRAEP